MSSVMYVLETDEIRGETYPVFIGGESSHRGRIRNKSAVKFLGNHGGKTKLSFHRGGRLYTNSWPAKLTGGGHSFTFSPPSEWVLSAQILFICCVLI